MTHLVKDTIKNLNGKVLEWYDVIYIIESKKIFWVSDFFLEGTAIFQAVPSRKDISTENLSKTLYYIMDEKVLVLVLAIANIVLEYKDGIEYDYSSTTLTKSLIDSNRALTKITINRGVTTIDTEACSSIGTLTEVYIGGEVTTIGARAFSGCSGLSKVIIDSPVQSIGTYAFSNCTSLKEITLPLNCTLETYAFYYCSNLTKLILPEGLTIVPASLCYQCTSLFEVYIPDSVQTIDTNAFYYCLKLDTVHIPSLLKTIGSQAFYYCLKIQKVELPDTLLTIGSSAFYYCTDIKELNLGPAITSIGTNAFYQMPLYKVTVKIPNVTATLMDTLPKVYKHLILKDTVQHIGVKAFANNTQLKSITIDSPILEIDNDAFFGDNQITLVSILDLDQFFNIRMFGDMTNSLSPFGTAALNLNFYPLLDLIVPEGITELGNNLSGFLNFRVLRLPKTITKLYSSFCNCKSLSDIYYDGRIEEFVAIDKDPSWNYSISDLCKIHCTDGTIQMQDMALLQKDLETLGRAFTIKFHSIEDAYNYCGITSTNIENDGTLWATDTTITIEGLSLYVSGNYWKSAYEAAHPGGFIEPDDAMITSWVNSIRDTALQSTAVTDMTKDVPIDNRRVKWSWLETLEGNAAEVDSEGIVTVLNYSIGYIQGILKDAVDSLAAKYWKLKLIAGVDYCKDAPSTTLGKHLYSLKTNIQGVFNTLNTTQLETLLPLIALYPDVLEYFTQTSIGAIITEWPSVINSLVPTNKLNSIAFKTGGVTLPVNATTTTLLKGTISFEGTTTVVGIGHYANGDYSDWRLFCREAYGRQTIYFDCGSGRIVGAEWGMWKTPAVVELGNHYLIYNGILIRATSVASTVYNSPIAFALNCAMTLYDKLEISNNASDTHIFVPFVRNNVNGLLDIKTNTFLNSANIQSFNITNK